METGGPLAEQLLDASALEHIHNGDWMSQVNNQLTQALLSKTDSEAALCSQLLRFVCSASDLGSSIDAEAFGQGVAQWVGHCIETVENTEGATQQYGDSETINIRISTALTETIWALSIEWEPDTAEESDEHWDDEKLGRLERNSRLIAITKGLLSADVISYNAFL
ncbi:hypothetical protein IWW35_005880 [Coemansia sp. RSA 1878]|nr:hypothetical protein IWW35_005880 [Coemansia sp. RSA 1878]